MTRTRLPWRIPRPAIEAGRSDMRAATTRAATALALASALFAYGGSIAQEQAKAPLGLPPVPLAIVGSAAMQRLGERLFFDRSLSANKTLSCAMCHIPAQGFTSNQSALSIGLEGRSLRRNAPTLYNVVFKKFLFHDGRETDLAAQVWGPLLAADEMGNPAIGPLLDRLRADAAYGPAFAEAFPGEGVSMTTLGRAIAAYEATLLKGDSRFDRAMYAGDKSALTPLELQGYEIFCLQGRLRFVPRNRRPRCVVHGPVLARHGRGFRRSCFRDDADRIGARRLPECSTVRHWPVCRDGKKRPRTLRDHRQA